MRRLSLWILSSVTIWFILIGCIIEVIRKNIFEVASPDDDMGGLVMIYPPEDACKNAIAEVAWEGFTGNYHQRLQDEFTP